VEIGPHGNEEPLAVFALTIEPMPVLSGPGQSVPDKSAPVERASAKPVKGRQGTSTAASFGPTQTLDARDLPPAKTR
jgi:hypothetical protein